MRIEPAGLTLKTMSKKYPIPRRRILKNIGVASAGVVLGGTGFVGSSVAKGGGYGVITNRRGFGQGEIFTLIEDLGDETVVCDRDRSSVTGREFETDWDEANIVLVNGDSFEAGDSVKAKKFWDFGNCNASWAFIVVTPV